MNIYIHKHTGKSHPDQDPDLYRHPRTFPCDPFQPIPLLLGLFIVQLLSHGLQRARLPCPSLSLGVCSDSRPLSQWCIQPSHPLLPPLLPAIFPSIRVFSNELALLIRCPKYWNFSFSPSNEYSGLIYFRIDWFYLSLHSKGLSRLFSNTTVQKHQFFSAQLSSQSKCHIHTWKSTT